MCCHKKTWVLHENQIINLNIVTHINVGHCRILGQCETKIKVFVESNTLSVKSKIVSSSILRSFSTFFHFLNEQY